MKLATIGYFDGVHRGHLCLLSQLKTKAAERGLMPVVITFRNHPRQVVQADYVPSLLTTPSEKLTQLERVGVEVKMIDFNEEISRMSALEFMRWMHDELQVTGLLMGYDHRFGHGGGTPEEYVRWGREAGIEVLRATEYPDVHVSSTAIRRLLQDGDVTGAKDLLGHPYLLQGVVTSGHQIGRELGFPTANVQPEEGKQLPSLGVYAVWVTLQDGTRWAGMLNIGSRPTMDNGSNISVEVNLFDFTGNLYNQQIVLEFVSWIRKEKRFAGREALVLQLHHDEAIAKEVLK